MLIFASYIILVFVDKSFYIYINFSVIDGQRHGHFKRHFDTIFTIIFQKVYSCEHCYQRYIVLPHSPKMIVVIQVPKQSHCVHSFGIIFFFYYIEFCHLGSWYMFFRYSSNLCMSKQNFTIFSLYVLHILIKFFLGISYFVAIVKNIFFS